MQLFWGKVINGAKRGRKLGFPTANISLHRKIPEGIYLAKVKVHKVVMPTKAGIQKEDGSRIKSGMTKEKWFPALTFVGKAETFQEKKVKAESYLLDFSGNVYGKFITVQLLKKIRDNKQFAGSEELIAQMNEDLAVARKFFSSWC